MSHFPKLTVAMAGPGLVLTACVPFDGATSAASLSVSAGPTSDGDAPPARPVKTGLPLQPYSTEGMGKRISKLPPSMVAHQIHRGAHPLEDGEPGSEHVVLVESLFASSRFGLPPEHSGDSISIEVTCTVPVKYNLELFDANDAELASVVSSCGPEGPSGILTGLGDTSKMNQLQISFEGQSELALGLVTYSNTAQD